MYIAELLKILFFRMINFKKLKQEYMKYDVFFDLGF